MRQRSLSWPGAERRGQSERRGGSAPAVGQDPDADNPRRRSPNNNGSPNHVHHTHSQDPSKSDLDVEVPQEKMRSRSATWPVQARPWPRLPSTCDVCHGHLMRSYTPPLSRATFHQDVDVYHISQITKEEEFKVLGHLREKPPCICHPSTPCPRGACKESQVDIDLAEVNFAKIIVDWVIFSIKFIIFFTLWYEIFYMFVTAGGYINVTIKNPPPKYYYNTYLDKDKLDNYKVLVVNNTGGQLELQIKIWGPFAIAQPGDNVHMNYQYERFWYEKSKFKQFDVNRREASSVEVDHTSWSKSYSQTITRTRLSVSSLPLTTSTMSTMYMTVCMVNRSEMSRIAIRKPYNFGIFDEDSTDYHNLTHTFPDYRTIPGRLYNHCHVANTTDIENISVIYALRYCLNTSEDITVAFALWIEKGIHSSYTTTTEEPPPTYQVNMTTGYDYCLIQFGLGSLLLFLQSNRALTVFATGISSFAIISFNKMRPTTDDIIIAMKWDFIVNYLFFMLLHAATADTGIYDIIAYFLAKFLIGWYPLLVVVMWLATTWLSMQINNMVAILFMTSICIRACEEFKVDPVPLLISLVWCANIGGMLSYQTSFPNYEMIFYPPFGYFKTLLLDFEKNFDYVLMPAFYIASGFTAIYFALIFFVFRPHVYKNYQSAVISHEQVLWNRAIKTIYRTSGDWWRVRDQMLEKIDDIDRRRINIVMGESTGEDGPSKNEKEATEIKLRNMSMVIKIGVVIFVHYFLSSLVKRKILISGGSRPVPPIWISVTCIGLLLILLNPPDLNLFFCRVDWSVIFMFLSMFQFSLGLYLLRLPENIIEKMKSPHYISADVEYWIQNTLYLTTVLSAVCSHMVSPLVILDFLKRIQNIYVEKIMRHLTWVLAIGFNIGGAATVLGTGPSIVCAASAMQQGYEIGACYYMLYSVPIAIINISVLEAYWTVFLLPDPSSTPAP